MIKIGEHWLAALHEAFMRTWRSFWKTQNEETLTKTQRDVDGEEFAERREEDSKCRSKRKIHARKISLQLAADCRQTWLRTDWEPRLEDWKHWLIGKEEEERPRGLRGSLLELRNF